MCSEAKVADLIEPKNKNRVSSYLCKQYATSKNKNSGFPFILLGRGILRKKRSDGGLAMGTQLTRRGLALLVTRPLQLLR